MNRRITQGNWKIRLSTPLVLEADNESNPYGQNATEVEITPYDGTSENPNDTVETILQSLGYTTEQIYALDENGQTLIDRIVDANELSDPNVIQSGNTLLVPTQAEVSPSSPETERLSEIPYGVVGGEHDEAERPDEIPHGVVRGEHDEAAQSNEPPDQISDPAADLRELTTNFDYLLGPENGEANLNDTATLDGGISDVADGNWNRDNFVQEWSDSYIGLRPDLSPEEAQAMAEARADRFQAGAERVLGNETLRNLVDAGRDGRNRLDGRFHLSDVLVVSELFGEEAGNAFETLNRLPRFCHSLDGGAVCWRTKREPGFEAMLTEVNNCGFESSVVCKLFASAVLV